MTDTTPLKGIPSRVPTGGFRSPPTSVGPNRPSMSRMPAGRKEGGVKLLEIGEQPLGYAAAKKRKREQEREEQQKKAAEQASAQASLDVKPVITTPTTSTPTTTPDYAAGLTASTVYSQPATPMPVTTVKETVVPTVAAPPQPIQTQPPPPPVEIKQEIKQEIKTEPMLTTSVPVQTVPIVASTPIVQQQTAPPVPPLAYTTPQPQKLISIKTEPTASIPMAVSSNPPSLVRTVTLPTSTQMIKTQPQQHIQQLPTVASSVQMIQNAGTTIQSKPASTAPKIEIISSKTIQPGTIQTSIPKSTTIINQGGNILFTTKQVQPHTTTSATGTTIIQQKQGGTYVLNTSPPGKQINIQRLITNASAVGTPTLTTTISRAQHQQQLLQAQQIQTQQQSHQQQTQQPTTPTRIVQIKTAPTVSLNNNQLLQNIPPLISTQHPGSGTQPTILNIQTIQQQQQQHQQHVQIQQQPSTPQKRTITITAQNPQNSNMVATSVAQLLQQQQLQQQQQQTIQTTSIVTGSTQQPKYAQVVMSPSVKGKTIYLTNPSSIPSVLNQKGVILRTVDPSGNTVYQQIPLQNVSGLSGTTIISGGPPGLVKTEPDIKPQLSQIPALVPTSSLHQNIPALTPVVLQQSQQQQTQQTSTIPALITNISQQSQPQTQQIKTSPQTMTILRPVGGGNNVQTVLPQGLTLIQRPGQQPQLVQTIQTGGQAQLQQQPQTRTIITQIPQQQHQQQQQQSQPQHTIQFQAAGTPRAGGTTIQLVQQPQQERTIVQQQPQQIQIQRTQIAQQQQQGTTVTIQQNAPAAGQPQAQQQGTRKGLSLSNKHVMEAHDMFKRANRVTRLEKALILGFMAGYRDNPRPNPENVVTIKLNESQEKVLQSDDTQAVMLVESLITLDYNTGEWKTFRKYRELDPSQQHEAGTAGQGGQATAQQNSVVI